MTSFVGNVTVADTEEDLDRKALTGVERFSKEDEQTLLKTSSNEKATGNQFFKKGQYDDAIQRYNKGLEFCPAYLEYEVAVLRSNISACYIKLEAWKAAVNAATESLDCLNRINITLEDHRLFNQTIATWPNSRDVQVTQTANIAIAQPEHLSEEGRSRTDVEKLKAKTLLRKAKANKEIGTWASLQEAQGDYQNFLSITKISKVDRTVVEESLKALSSELAKAKEREMSEMVSKLKQLGNGLLKPFGLSTNNFQLTKDEQSGGYSMQFNQEARR